MKSSLRRLVSAPGAIVMPGVFDALSAILAEQAGFPGVFLSGSAMSYTMLGRPDIGLVSLSEVADTVARVSDRIAVPIMVDADSGFGNALNVGRTVKLLERAGASAIQIEDQINFKPPGDLQSRPLVSVGEMVGKIKSALDARASTETLISARSDAPFTETIDQALARADAYAEAGADIVFVEGLKTRADVERVAAAMKGKKPLLYNLIDSATAAVPTVDELAALGFKIVLCPGVAVQAAATAMQAALATLKTDGHTRNTRATQMDSKALNALIGTPEVIANAKRYSPTV